MIRAFIELGAHTLSEFAAVIQKTPQIIASAFVGSGPHLSRNVLGDLENQCRANLPALHRINLRYSGTEPLFRAMLEADDRLTEQDLADIAWEICIKAQTAAGVSNGEMEILNCTRGGLLTHT
jgi:phosphomannomutase